MLRGLSQQDLAMAVAASEQHVAAALAELRGERLVETGRLRFRLPAPEKLGGASPGNQGEPHRPAVQDLRNRGRQPRGPGT
ncbi:helix-turn-helix domain-containing protein [Actinokineospora sp. PR83]|nr:helix-turn-helix domain-containing protein [Actinokineospora sp. PR83]